MQVNDLPLYGGTLSVFASYFIDPSFFKNTYTNMQQVIIELNKKLTRQSNTIPNNRTHSLSANYDISINYDYAIMQNLNKTKLTSGKNFIDKS